ncbi:MAG: hypothetical protein HY899_16055 [Deltaproteobacteria bacterium]|nr:hypothetical protein [Deltaproteobacteria bacterium]
MSLLSITFAAFAFCMASATIASAQTVYDHLECHKMHDAKGYAFHATVNLNPLAPGFPGLPAQSGCTVKIKGIELCVPVAKTVTQTDDPNVIAAVGQDLVNGFICYKMKCPVKPDGTAATAGDQFGVRDVAPSTVTKICAPADW